MDGVAKGLLKKIAPQSLKQAKTICVVDVEVLLIFFLILLNQPCHCGHQTRPPESVLSARLASRHIVPTK